MPDIPEAGNAEIARAFSVTRQLRGGMPIPRHCPTTTYRSTTWHCCIPRSRFRHTWAWTIRQGCMTGSRLRSSATRWS